MNLGATFVISLTALFLANAQAAEVSFRRDSATVGPGNRKMEVRKIPMETDGAELKSLIELATRPGFLNGGPDAALQGTLGAPKRMKSGALPGEEVSTIVTKFLPVEPVAPRYGLRKTPVVDHYEQKNLTIDVPVYKTNVDRVEIPDDSSASDAQ